MKKEITRECSLCGKKLPISLDEEGNFLGGHFFGIIKIGVGDWVTSKLVDGEFQRCISYYKILYYRLRDIKRLILKQYREFEYWECEECYNEEY